MPAREIDSRFILDKSFTPSGQPAAVCGAALLSNSQPTVRSQLLYPAELWAREMGLIYT